MIIFSVIGTGFAVIGFIYMFLRNFKTDINNKISRLEARLDLVDDRMFWLMTGKKLDEVILEERLKRKEG